MAEEKIEETIENPEEVETPEKETTETEQETVKKPEKTASELEEANKRLYARMKKAEEEAKSTREELEKSKQEKPTRGQPDVLSLAKTIATLKDYNSNELGDISLIAKAKELSLEEAVKTEEAQALITARRKKVEDEQSKLEPSTKMSPSEKSIDKITAKDLREMPPDKKREALVKMGWIKEGR